MVSKADYWKNPEKYRKAANEYRLAHPEWKKKSAREWVGKKRKESAEFREKEAVAGNIYRKKHQTARQAATLKWVHGKPGYYLWKNAQYRAVREGLAFNLRREDIDIPAFCPVLGIRIEASLGRRGLSPCSPSVDKILPTLGYVVGNIRVISNLANILKRGEVSPDNLRKVADYIEREVARVERELAG